MTANNENELELKTKQSILLVDDDQTLLDVLTRALEKRQWETQQALSEPEALASIESTPFECALVDLKLGSDSGLQLIPKLLEVQPSLKIVVLTGYSSIATAVEAIKLGAMNYLCKPADANEILQAFTQGREQINTPPASPPSVDRLEWEHIQKVLQENQGNISATARALGMHRRTLQRKLKKRPVRH